MNNIESHESNQAVKFLEATVFIQDNVYTRTCDLQDIHAVFGGGLYCHKQCINRYLVNYEHLRSSKSARSGVKSSNRKREAWTHISNIEIGLANGKGYEISFDRDAMHKQTSWIS